MLVGGKKKRTIREIDRWTDGKTRQIDTRRERDKQTNALTNRETDVMTDGRTDKTLSFIIFT